MVRHQEFVIQQQYMIGDIKINTKAQLDRKYTRLLLDAFFPYQEEMLTYLDELIRKYDPQPIEQKRKKIEKQSTKKFNELMRVIGHFDQEEVNEGKKIFERFEDLKNERNELDRTVKELRDKLDIHTRSQNILRSKRKAVVTLLQRRQAMLEEGTWEKIGGKDGMSSVFSLMGSDSIGFGFSKIMLEASPINDIYDWMMYYHPDVLPLDDPFPAPSPLPTPKKVSVPKKKEEPAPPQAEFPHVPDEVTASIREFLATQRPGYTLFSLLDRSSNATKAWLAILTRKVHNGRIEHVSDVIIELEPQKYVTIQNVQISPDSHASS